MKKLLLLVVCSFCAWQLLGQSINTSIIGIELGGTCTPEQIQQSLKQQYDIDSAVNKESSWSVVFSNYYVPFAGYNWRPYIKLTKDNKVAEIALIYSEISFLGSDFGEKSQAIYRDLLFLLNKKYGRSSSSQTGGSRWGKDIGVTLDNTKKGNVRLSYFDASLMAQIESDLLEEL